MAQAAAVQAKMKIKATMREVTILFCANLVCVVKYFVLESITRIRPQSPSTEPTANHI